MPVNSRARSASAIGNDRKISSAAIAEAAQVGLDGVGFGSVAHRAGMTTGALYSRYADSQDLVAALWQDRLSTPTTELLRSLMTDFVLSPGTCGSSIVQRVEKLSLSEKVGLEAMMIAPRLAQLDEVLSDDIRGMLAAVGVKKIRDLDTLRAVMGLSTILGCVLQRGFQKDLSYWSDAINVVSLVASRMKPVTGRDTTVRKVGSLRAVTDSELRNLLVDAVADVVARSGVEAATVARITRRARLTSGAIYTLYDSRDELVLDAMEHMLGQAVADAAQIVREGELQNSVADATATVFHLATCTERVQWRRFRLETYVSARTNRSIAAVLRRLQADGHKRYENMFADNPEMSPTVVAMLSRIGQNQPIGLSVIEPYVPGFDKVDFRPYTSSLIEVRKIFNGS